MLLKRLCFFVKKHKEITQEQKATVGTDLDGSVMQGECGNTGNLPVLPSLFSTLTFSLPTGKNPTLNQLTLNQVIMAKSRKKEVYYYLGFTGSSSVASHSYKGVLNLIQITEQRKYIDWRECSEDEYEAYVSTYEPNTDKTIIE